MIEQSDGILNINKASGWTSHDVVARVRRVLGTSRVGHAGTLDPMATGVLIVCVGMATRVAEFLMASRKVYRAVARLGVVTDTYDVDGNTTAIAPLPSLTRDQVVQVLLPFLGDIEQRPPAYSAVKQDGVPAYRRARRGEDVHLAARKVSVYGIEVLDWQPPDLTIEVTCGPGTYIRSLVHDFGQALGCGATLAALTRLRSGRFTLDDAIGTDALAEAVLSGQASKYLHPIEAALCDLVRVVVDDQTAARLKHGQAIPSPVPPEATRGYALGPDGKVLAILCYDAGRQQWQPDKVFAA
jgi:tRNA pseudouridine55 synthase